MFSAGPEAADGIFKKCCGEGYGFCGQRFTGVGRIGGKKTSRSQIPAEQRAETVGECFGKAIAELFNFFIRAAQPYAKYSYEHEGSFHKAALGAESTCSMHAGGGMEYLGRQVNLEFFCETCQYGLCAVVVFFPVKFVYVLCGIVHACFLRRKIFGTDCPEREEDFRVPAVRGRRFYPSWPGAA